jgi:hypothetical protein
MTTSLKTEVQASPEKLCILRTPQIMDNVQHHTGIKDCSTHLSAIVEAQLSTYRICRGKYLQHRRYRTWNREFLVSQATMQVCAHQRTQYSVSGETAFKFSTLFAIHLILWNVNMLKNALSKSTSLNVSEFYNTISCSFHAIFTTPSVCILSKVRNDWKARIRFIYRPTVRKWGLGIKDYFLYATKYRF